MKKSGVQAHYAGKSAWEMAEKGLGSYQHLWRVLTGRRAPSVELAGQIAKYCGKTRDEFVKWLNREREKAVKEDRYDTYIRGDDSGLGKLARTLRVRGAEGKGSPLGTRRSLVGVPTRKERIRKKRVEITKKK